jgi:RimJ/RimL family protein N-acetyltransferase
VTVRLRLIDEPAAHEIAAGRCPQDCRCAPDYPAESDRIAAQLFLERCAAGADPRPYGAFLVCLADSPDDDGFVIGGIGFHGGVDERGRVEIGYGIVPSQQGQGHAKEAVELLVKMARELGADTLTAETEPANLASQAVLRHAAFASGRTGDHPIAFERILR